MITQIMNSINNMIFIIEAGIIKQPAMNNEITITIILLMMWRSDCEE